MVAHVEPKGETGELATAVRLKTHKHLRENPVAFFFESGQHSGAEENLGLAKSEPNKNTPRWCPRECVSDQSLLHAKTDGTIPKEHVRPANTSTPLGREKDRGGKRTRSNRVRAPQSCTLLPWPSQQIPSGLRLGSEVGTAGGTPGRAHGSGTPFAQSEFPQEHRRIEADPE